MTGDQFEKIYQLYFSRVYRYLLKLSGDEQLAEELTSETFFKAMQALDSFRGDCHISSWLCQIAKNCYISEQRRKKLLPIDEIIDGAIGGIDEEFSPERLFEQEETASKLHRVIHNLEKPYKEVFLLRVFGELSFRQIGAIFGRTENWACVTYHRGKRKIQTEMERNNGYRIVSGKLLLG